MDPRRFVPNQVARARQVMAVRADASFGFLQRDLCEEALRTPPEPVFSRDELADARQAGRRDGHAAGLAEAAAALAAAQTAALEVIARAMAAGEAEAARVADNAAAELSGLLVAAMHAVMPELIRRSALGEAGAMLAHVLPGLSREPEVRIAVPPAIAPGIDAMLDRLPQAQRARIAVGAFPGMEDGAVQVRWEAGQARRQAAQVWQAVMDVLEPALDVKDCNHGQ